MTEQEVSKIAAAREADLSAISALLAASSLPAEGIREHLATALVARRAGRVVGCVVLELHGGEVLLRSLAVEEEFRGTGLGVALATAACDLARNRGARRVFLLTETASGLFGRLGFHAVARSEVPVALLQSAEFQDLCPASALVMTRSLS